MLSASHRINSHIILTIERQNVDALVRYQSKDTPRVFFVIDIMHPHAPSYPTMDFSNK